MAAAAISPGVYETKVPFFGPDDELFKVNRFVPKCICRSDKGGNIYTLQSHVLGPLGPPPLTRNDLNKFDEVIPDLFSPEFDKHSSNARVYSYPYHENKWFDPKTLASAMLCCADPDCPTLRLAQFLTVETRLQERRRRLKALSTSHQRMEEQFLMRHNQDFLKREETLRKREEEVSKREEEVTRREKELSLRGFELQDREEYVRELEQNIPAPDDAASDGEESDDDASDSEDFDNIPLSWLHVRSDKAIIPNTFSCPMCKRADNDEMIACDNVDRCVEPKAWYHIDCVNVSKSAYSDLINKQQIWVCRGCQESNDTISRGSSDSEGYSDSGSDSYPGSEADDDDDDAGDADKTAPPSTKMVPLSQHRAPPKPDTSAKGAAPAVGGRRKPTKWRPDEKEALAACMDEVVLVQKDGSERKWQKVSDLLMSRFAVDRTKCQVKMQWAREGRAASGLDERNKPRPDKMCTGVQNPEDRKRKREEKKMAKGEGSPKVKKAKCQAWPA